MEAIKKGDRFTTVDDTPVHGLTVWGAPYTGGFRCVIPKGTVLVVAHDPVTGALGFTVVPEEYEKMEEVLVPEEDRTSRKYGGYYFVFTYDELGTKLVNFSSENIKESKTNILRRSLSPKELLQVAIGLAGFILVIVIGESLKFPIKYTFFIIAIGIFFIGHVFSSIRR
jgi:hypothetical protein